MGSTAAQMPEFPPEIDTSRPHPARVYDYYLGGKNHFAADREVADRVMAAWPTMRIGIRENREFLGRAVRYLAAEAGIRQFLDIGSGLPTTSNVHEIAQDVDPSCRVVYVDNDPLVLAHARALLTSAPEGRTAYIQADVRDPASILDNPTAREVLDFGQPIALMLVALVHILSDEEKPGEIIATLLDALPSGSYLVASHVTGEHDPNAAASQAAFRQARLPAYWRDSDVFARLAFTGLELVPPGVVLISEWRAEPDGAPPPSAAEVSCYGGVGRKP